METGQWKIENGGEFKLQAQRTDPALRGPEREPVLAGQLTTHTLPVTTDH
ncbi:MAG: hypothetical protein ABSE93_20830 [Terriglobia bacterium]